jgi:hypothetical protein
MSGEAYKPVPQIAVEQQPQGRPISLISELSNWTREKLGSNPPLRLWAAIDDASTYIDRFGDAASKETAWKVKWAYTAIALAEEKTVSGEPIEGWMSANAKQFEQFREEQAKRGEQGDEITLNSEQAHALKWALDTAGIPFEANEEDDGVSVSIEPLARTAAGTEFAQTRHMQEGDKAAFRRAYHMPERAKQPGRIIDLEAVRAKRQQ